MVLSTCAPYEEPELESICNEIIWKELGGVSSTSTCIVLHLDSEEKLLCLTR